MRQIHLANDLRIRFPQRSEDFCEGLEVGMIAALMSFGSPEIQRRIAVGSLDQLRALASKLGYYLGREIRDAEWSDVTFYAVRARPKLQLVHSRGERVPFEAAAS